MLVLFSIIIILASVAQSIQYGHAQNIRTFSIKAQLDEPIVKLGDSNEIRVKVFDRASDKPLSGTLVETVAVYPGGTYYRAVSELTDLSGEASITIPTNEDSESDTIEVGVTVSQTGYPDATFTMYFLAVSKNIND